MHDSGQVSLEYLLLSWNTNETSVEPTNPESITNPTRGRFVPATVDRIGTYKTVKTSIWS